MKSLKGKPQYINVYDKLGRGQKLIKTSDKSSLMKRGDWYYLIYGHRYAMSKNLFGPYVFKGNFLNGGHTSEFNWKGQWYVVQENHDISACYRGISLKPIEFNPDGTIIVPSDDACYPGPGRSWDFRASIMGWKAVSGTTINWVKPKNETDNSSIIANVNKNIALNGKISGTLSDEKALIHSAFWLYTDYKECKTLSVSLRNETDANIMEVAIIDRNEGNEFWRRGNTEPNWNSLYWIKVPIIAHSEANMKSSNGYKTYTIDLTNIPNRKDKIMQVAIRPASNASSGKWSIRSVKIK